MGKSRRSARVASTPLFRSASTVSRASLRFTESRRALPARTRILGAWVACMIYLAFRIYDVEGLFWDSRRGRLQQRDRNLPDPGCRRQAPVEGNQVRASRLGEPAEIAIGDRFRSRLERMRRS